MFMAVWACTCADFSFHLVTLGRREAGVGGGGTCGSLRL